MQQPVRVQLGDAGENIDDANLSAQGPQRPQRNRAATQRQRRQQQADQAHQVVMVEVRGAVNQLNVGKADAEQSGAYPPAIARYDADAEQSQRGKVRVHPPAGPGSRPAEPQVGKVIIRFNVQRANPPMGEKARHRYQPQQAEDDAKGRCRRAVNRTRRCCDRTADLHSRCAHNPVNPQIARTPILTTDYPCTVQQ